MTPADEELAEPAPGETRGPKGAAGGLSLTPAIVVAGWVGLLGPAAGLAAVHVARRGPPDHPAAYAMAAAVAALCVLPGLAAGSLGAAVARLERDRRGADWPLGRTDCVGAFLSAHLGAAALLALNW